MTEQAVTDVLPSAYFFTARVFVLACGHRHVRPIGTVALGEMFPCYACDEGLPPWSDPELEAK
jgi:hypothetical protein